MQSYNFHKALLLALNNRLQLAVLQHELKPRAYLYFEKLFKRNPRALRSFFFLFFFVEIGSEEGTQYEDIANSLFVKVYLLCSDTVDSRQLEPSLTRTSC